MRFLKLVAAAVVAAAALLTSALADPPTQWQELNKVPGQTLITTTVRNNRNWYYINQGSFLWTVGAYRIHYFPRVAGSPQEVYRCSLVFGGGTWNSYIREQWSNLIPFEDVTIESGDNYKSVYTGNVLGNGVVQVTSHRMTYTRASVNIKDVTHTGAEALAEYQAELPLLQAVPANGGLWETLAIPGYPVGTTSRKYLWENRLTDDVWLTSSDFPAFPAHFASRGKNVGAGTPNANSGTYMTIRDQGQISTSGWKSFDVISPVISGLQQDGVPINYVFDPYSHFVEVPY